MSVHMLHLLHSFPHLRVVQLRRGVEQGGAYCVMSFHAQLGNCNLAVELTACPSQAVCSITWDPNLKAAVP